MTEAGRLAAILAGFERLAVAVSGGVDSMTLAHVAHSVLGRRARMMHAVSAAVPPEATARVEAHAARHGWAIELIDAGEMTNPDYLANPVDRCFFCKQDLYGAIRAAWDGPIASGTNTDDLGDFRPGLIAARAHGVRHPFVEAGLAKARVRAIASELSLDDLAELPAAPCLSSRIETGIPVTAGRLALILAIERLLLAELGSGTARARLRKDGIEVELAPDLMARADPAHLLPAIEALQDRLGRVGPVRLAPYVMGSAFLRDPAP